jgi:hypothetical protein
MRSLFVLFAVLWALPAVAQVGPGPVGAFTMYDATDRAMGAAIPATGLAYGAAAFTLETPAGPALIPVYASGFGPQLDTILVYEGEVYFDGSGCTGNAYVRLGEMNYLPGVDGAPPIVPTYGLSLYKVTGPTGTASLGPNYSFAQLGTCTNIHSTASLSLVPLEYIGSMAGEFVPPFTIRVEAAAQPSQVSALGVMGSWLLVAALISWVVFYRRSEI